MKKELETLQFVKNATTKTTTELTGSNTFYFKEGYVYAYNNIVSIRAKTDYTLEGSVPAEKFYQLLHKISEDEITVTDKESNFKIRYGKHTATIQKEVSGLSSYMNIIFNESHMKQPVPSDFLEALATSKFQTYSNKLSGIYVDDTCYYAIDTSDISRYESTEGFAETFWLPREGVLLLRSIPEELEYCALSRSFFYVFTEHYTVAVKLKLCNEFPISILEKFMNQFTDYSHVITMPVEYRDTLNRIKLATAKDKNDRHVFHMTTGDMLELQSIGVNSLAVHESLLYEKQNITKKTYEIPIENFMYLDNTIHILESGNNVAVAMRTEKHVHFIRIGVVL
jgi:hypothetical protein